MNVETHKKSEDKKQEGLSYKCPNCKKQQKLEQYILINLNPNMPPFFACVNCGNIFLHKNDAKAFWLKIKEGQNRIIKPSLVPTGMSQKSNLIIK